MKTKLKKFPPEVRTRVTNTKPADPRPQSEVHTVLLLMNFKAGSPNLYNHVMHAVQRHMSYDKALYYDLESMIEDWRGILPENTLRDMSRKAVDDRTTRELKKATAKARRAAKKG